MLYNACPSPQNQICGQCGCQTAHAGLLFKKVVCYACTPDPMATIPLGRGTDASLLILGLRCLATTI